LRAIVGGRDGKEGWLAWWAADSDAVEVDLAEVVVAWWRMNGCAEKVLYYDEVCSVQMRGQKLPRIYVCVWRIVDKLSIFDFI
jgi:hypothetical protein